MDIPTSDIEFWDLDGDGREELAVIEGFHGNNVAVFKEEMGSYVRALDLLLRLATFSGQAPSWGDLR